MTNKLDYLIPPTRIKSLLGVLSPFRGTITTSELVIDDYFSMLSKYREFTDVNPALFSETIQWMQKNGLIIEIDDVNAGSYLARFHPDWAEWSQQWMTPKQKNILQKLYQKYVNNEGEVLFQEMTEKTNPIDERISLLYFTLYERENLIEAIRLGIKLRQTYEHAFYALAEAYSNLQQYENLCVFAEWVLQALKEAKPKKKNSLFVGILGVIGHGYNKLGQPEKALKKFEEARQIIDELNLIENQPDQVAKFLLNYAIVLLKLEKRKAWEKYIKKVDKFYTQNRIWQGLVEVWVNLSFQIETPKDKLILLIKLNDFLKKNNKLEDYAAWLNMSWGYYYFKINNSKKAKTFLNIALEEHESAKRERESALCNFMLGKIHYRQKRYQKANYFFEKTARSFSHYGHFDELVDLYSYIGVLHFIKGEKHFSIAQEYAEEGLRLCSKIGETNQCLPLRAFLILLAILRNDKLKLSFQLEQMRLIYDNSQNETLNTEWKPIIDSVRFENVQLTSNLQKGIGRQVIQQLKTQLLKCF